MEYIQEIRKYIGHKTILVPHSITLVFNKNNEILIEIRKDDGMYDFPGGGINIDEDVTEAAKRELKEETGLTATSIKFFKIYSGPITHYTYANGDEISGVDIVYIVDEYIGELVPQKEEVNQLIFMKLNQIPRDKLSPRNIKIIDDLNK